MNRVSNLSVALRTVSALALVFALNVTVLPQHEGHDMSKMKPAAKPKAKRAPRKKRVTRARQA